MKTVPGIAGADAIGGYAKQYRIERDPARLAAYGIFLQPDRRRY